MRLRPLAFVLALTCLPALAASEPGRTPADVVQRWIRAVGGEKRVRKAANVVLTGESTQDGMTGRVTERIEDGAWRRVTVTSGRTSERSGRAGVSWAKDWNGKVAELEGRDRRDQESEIRIASLLYGAALARLAASPDLALDGDVLKFTPPGGIPFDLTLDKATGLPVKIVRKPYDDVITLEFSDWRLVAGRKVPFSVRETTGDGEGGATTVWSDIVLGATPLAPAIGRPADGPNDYRFTEGSSARGIPFNFENDHLMVEGRVNGGKPVWFMLDTGAEATFVNKVRMAEFGLTPLGASTISGGGNSTDLAFTDVASLAIGSVELVNQRNGVIDLTGLERIYGMPMGGILGYDFFSRFVVRVNYDDKTIDLIEPSIAVADAAGIALPFVLENGQPHIASTISVSSGPPIAADLIVDCGAADTVNLTTPFVKANGLLERARKKPAGAPNTMAGSEKEFFAQTSVRGKLAGLTLATFTLADIPVNLMLGTKGAYASDAFSATLGEGILRRFNADYDYGRGVMMLTPNAELKKPFPPRRTFGATFLSDGTDYTRFTVTGVRKDSPAEAAGLKKDDLIATVDGKPAARLRLADLRKLLTEEGAHRVLEIRRGDRELTVETDVKLVSLDEN